MESLLRRIIVNRDDGEGGYFAGGLDAIILFVCQEPTTKVDERVSAPLTMGALTPRDWVELVVHHCMRIQVEPGTFVYDLLSTSYQEKPLEIADGEIPYLHEVVHDLNCRIAAVARMNPEVEEGLKEAMFDILQSRYRK